MAVWVAVSVNTLQANSQGFQTAPLLPERINVTVSGTTGTSQPLHNRPGWTGSGGSLAEGLLSVGHDLILARTGYRGKTYSGGLAILCKQAAPQQRMEDGHHWEAGRWAHYILPYEGGLH
eukprot:1204078-Amphidinium_carterae.1